MGTETDSLLILGIVLTIVVAAGLSSAETIFLSLDRVRLSIHASHQPKWRRVADFLDHPEQFVVATLTGNNLVTVIYSSLLAMLLARHGVSEGVIILISPLLLLVLGETIPKALGRQVAHRAAPAYAFALHSFRTIAQPLLGNIERSVRTLQRWFGLPPGPVERLLSRSDITWAVSTAHLEGTVSQREERIIQRLLKLNDSSVSDVMTPRMKVSMIQLEEPVGEAIRLTLTTGHKRLICYGQSKDDLLGLIRAGDLIGQPKSLESILRPLPTVPESLPIVRLIAWLKTHRTHFTAVIDEYGGFAGVISVEDLAEELVGPIDRWDRSGSLDCLRITSKLWLVSGSARLSHVEQITGFNPESGRSSTMAGYIAGLEEGIPKVGCEYLVHGTKLRVIKADQRGARLVRLALD